MNDQNVPNKKTMIGPSLAMARWTLEDVWNTGFIPAYNDQLYALSVERSVSNHPIDIALNIHHFAGTHLITVLPCMQAWARRETPRSSLRPTSRTAAVKALLDHCRTRLWLLNRLESRSSCSKRTRRPAVVSQVSVTCSVSPSGHWTTVSRWCTVTLPMRLCTLVDKMYTIT